MGSGKIGVIGGSGLYSMAGLEEVTEVHVETPFGPPSDAYILGTLHGLLKTRFFDGFQNIVDGVHVKRLHSVLIVGRNEDHLRQLIFAGQMLDHFEPIQSRHFNVQEQQIGLEFLH